MKNKIKNFLIFSALFILIYMGLSFTILAEEETVFRSGEQQVTLLELFTSQGCSSCPPAERWLNGWKNHKELWKSIIPVSFHVTYWDRLGWKDSFGSKSFTERQYNYRKAGQVRSVYTPCFVIDGQEWRGWFDGQKPALKQTKQAELSAGLSGNTLNVTYAGNREKLDLHVAVLGFGLKTDVKRGENRNKLLEEDFVALAHDVHSSENGKWNVEIPTVQESQSGKLGIALWVCRHNEMTPLQATGGWLPEK